MAWVTSDPQIRQLRKAEAPMGWFPFPPAQGAAGLKFLSLTVTPSTANLVTCHFQSPEVQVPTQFPDAALAFPPPPATFERGKGDRRGAHAQQAKQGREEK